MQIARESVIKPVYCYIYCNFQQNIPLFCAVSDFMVLLLIAGVWQSRKLLIFSCAGHYVLSLARGKNLARSRSPRFSLALALAYRSK